MRIQLVDSSNRDHLLPLTFTRPVSALRCGILTIAEKYAQRGHVIGNDTQSYLQRKYPSLAKADVAVDGGVCPTDEFLAAAEALTLGQSLCKGDTVIAWKGEKPADTAGSACFEGPLNIVARPWDIWGLNATELEADFDLLTAGRTSAPIHESCTVIGDRIFLEEGAKATASILNATSGAIYLAKDAEIMEGSVIRGPFALCEEAQVKLASKIYGATTVGPHCRVGGEVNNSVLFGYSNKGHDGFLGNAVLGEWCNIGADSNNSNLKNNYEEVRLWSYETEGFARTGLQFCGLMMQLTLLNHLKKLLLLIQNQSKDITTPCVLVILSRKVHLFVRFRR